MVACSNHVTPTKSKCVLDAIKREAKSPLFIFTLFDHNVDHNWLYKVSESERSLTTLLVVKVLIDVTGKAGAGMPEPFADNPDINTIFDEAGVRVTQAVNAYLRYASVFGKAVKDARKVARVQVRAHL